MIRAISAAALSIFAVWVMTFAYRASVHIQVAGGEGWQALLTAGLLGLGVLISAVAGRENRRLFWAWPVIFNVGTLLLVWVLTVGPWHLVYMGVVPLIGQVVAGMSLPFFVYSLEDGPEREGVPRNLWLRGLMGAAFALAGGLLAIIPWWALTNAWDFPNFGSRYVEYLTLLFLIGFYLSWWAGRRLVAYFWLWPVLVIVTLFGAYTMFSEFHPGRMALFLIPTLLGAAVPVAAYRWKRAGGV